MADRIENRSLSLSMGEILYYMMFGILLLSKAIGWYDGMPQFKAVLLVSTALFACKLLVTRMSMRDWVLVLLVCGLSVASYYCSGDKSLILYAYMMLGIKDVPVRCVMKWALVVWSAGFVALTALCAFGVLPEKILVHPKHFFGYVICHTLGYAHPNVLHVSYVLFAALVLYLVDGTRSHRLLWTSSALLFIGNIIVFLNSISFTGALIVLFLLVLNLYLQLRGAISRAESLLLQCILPVCLVFSLVGPMVLHGTQVYQLINKALNTRYELTHYFLTEQPVTLLGSRLTVPNYRFTMDCSYTFLLVQLGVIPFVLVMIGIFLLIRDALREHRYEEAAMVIAFCVGGVSEPFLFNTSFKNMTFVFLGVYVYRRLAARGGEQHAIVEMEVPAWLSGMIGRGIRGAQTCCRRMASSLEQWGAAMVALFTGVTIILTVVLFCRNPWATSIYVPDEWHDNQTLETLSLAEEDVTDILAGHGEVIGETSQYGEMVQCEADTLRAENLCKSVNLAAAIAAEVMLVVMLRNGRARQLPVFLGWFAFFTIVCPLVLYDADDWIYIAYDRLPVPIWGGWNPTRVLPETLMPLVGWISGHVLYPLVGDYVLAVTLLTAVLLAALIAIVGGLLYRLCEHRIGMQARYAYVTEWLFMIGCLLIYRNRGGSRMLYSASSICTTYFYTISGLVNAICVLVMMQHARFEERYAEVGLARKVAFWILVYFSIFSNLFHSGILAIYCGSILLMAGVEHLRGERHERTLWALVQGRWIELVILALWFVAVLFELSGGRAGRVSDGQSISLLTSVRQLLTMMQAMNKVFAVALVISVVLLAYRGIHEYRSSQGMHRGRLCIVLLLDLVLLVVYQLALNARILYMSRIEASWGIWFYCVLIVALAMGGLLQQAPRPVCGMAIAVLFALALYPDGTYANSNIDAASYEACASLDHVAIDAIERADRQQVNETQISIPDYSSTDNAWAFRDNYGQLVADALYRNGVIGRQIRVTTVMDGMD